MKIRVLVVDDHKMFREGLISLLKGLPEIEVVGEAQDGYEAIRLAQELNPEIVIMDVAMPGLNGVDAARRVLEKTPGIKIIGVSMHSDRRFVSGMLEAGAVGYLIKDCAFEELAQAIGTVRESRTYLSPAVAKGVVDDYMQQRSSQVRLRGSLPLTAREREVLQLLAEGRSTKDVASVLHVSVKTVETHRKHIMDKLDLHSIAELTKYAIREGYTSLHA